MADKEEEKEQLSQFDQWEADAAKQEAEQQAQKIEQLVQADPANTLDFETQAQAAAIGQALQNTDVEQKEMTVQKEADIRSMNLEAPDPVRDQQPKQDFDTALAQAGQALNQAGVETQEQSPFDQWEARAAQIPEQTQAEPEQQQNKEQEQER